MTTDERTDLALMWLLEYARDNNAVADGKHAARVNDCIVALRADLARVTAERDRLEAALAARHGGEPVALLAELDAARAEVDQWRREHEVMCIEAKDARARSRQDADERDAARADLARAQTRIDGLEGVATQLREVRAKLEAERDEARRELEKWALAASQIANQRDEALKAKEEFFAAALVETERRATVETERDAHKARADDAVAQCSVLLDFLSTVCTCGANRIFHDSDAIGVAVAERDERLKREEQRVFYGGLALAFGLKDEDLDSVGSSVVEKIRARIARDARAGRDAEWLLVLGVAGVEPTPCTPEQMRGAFAAARVGALEEAAREACFKCQSPQLFPLDPTQHGRYHVPAEHLARPIADRDHSSCEGTQILRLFHSPLFPDRCGTPCCPCCAALAASGDKP